MCVRQVCVDGGEVSGGRGGVDVRRCVWMAGRCQGGGAVWMYRVELIDASGFR